MNNRPKTILVAQELGAGRGHISKLAPIIRSLRDQGHRVIVAVRDLNAVPQGLADAVIQAPLHHPRSTLPPSVSYPEVLMRVGYAEAARLAGLTQAWCHLLSAFAVDVMLAEHAPTALVAARVHALPVVLIGTGFTLPGRGSPMPSFALGKPVPVERLRLSEQHVVDTINQVLQQLGSSPLARLDELFDVTRTLCTVAELDHIDNRTGDNFAGFIWPETPDAEPRWPAGDGDPVFAYVNTSHPAIKDLVNALNLLRRPTLVVIPGLNDSQLNELQRAHVRVSREPIDMNAVAAACRTIVSHSGHGVVATSLCHGIAPVLLPGVLEQWILARRLQEQKMAVLVKTREGASTLEKAIHVADNEAGLHAARFSIRHPATLQPERSAMLVERISEQIMNA